MRWYTHNLNDLINEKKDQFSIKFIPKYFDIMPFEDAVLYTIKTIQNINKKIFVAYSGGIDSEYVILSLKKYNVPFTAIIVDHPYNNQEIEFANHICRTNKMVYIKLNCPKDLFWAVCNNYILKKMKLFGCGSTASIIAANYANRMNGILITGEHFIGDDINCVDELTANSYDYYIDYFFPNILIPFFNYTPEITYALTSLFEKSNLLDFKQKVFQLSFRPKMKNIYDSEFMNNFNLNKSKRNVNENFIIDTKESFINMMKPYSNIKKDT